MNVVLRGNLPGAAHDRRSGAFTTGDRYYEIDEGISPNLKYVNQAKPAERAALVVARIPPDIVSKKRTNKTVMVNARIDHGRWIVECPFRNPAEDYEPCKAAQMACVTDPRFLCHMCVNAEVGGAFIPVIFPNESTMESIERELKKRPHRSLRHWLPDIGETVETIILENRKIGIEPG